MTKSDTELRRLAILNCLAEAYPEGLSQRDLSKVANMHRETISIHISKLISEGLVVREHRRGKYRLTERTLGNYSLKARMYSESALSAVTMQEMPLQKRQLEDLVAKVNKDASEIFEFANKIGAFMIYQFIEGIRIGADPQYNRIVYGKRHSDQNRLPELWASTAARPEKMLWYFKQLKCVAEGIRSHDKVAPNARPPRLIGDNTMFYYYLSHEQITRLREAFRIAYPYLFAELERFRNELPNRIQAYRRYANVTDRQIARIVKKHLEKKATS